MKILQQDILGGKHDINPEKIKNPTAPLQKKPFAQPTILDGLDATHAAHEAMLIHRTLQKKILFNQTLNLKQKTAFIKILENEMKIKKGKMDPATATRSSLLAFFT